MSTDRSEWQEYNNALFATPKERPPKSSWWTEIPREGFTAFATQEQQTRMQFDQKIGARGKVLTTARTIGTSGEIKRKTARRRAL